MTTNETRLTSVPMAIIARIHTDFPAKFGVPRQSGLIDALEAEIVFEKEYRRPEAFRGLENYSHLWLLWHFSEAARADWSPTVRPPRLGGNRRMGVVATRSPFRPNAIGLSAVRLLGVEQTADRGPVLRVAGADLMDGTPIFDVKPYLPYADAHADATGGFTDEVAFQSLKVDCPAELFALVPEAKREALLRVLASDPRPHYQSDAERLYGFGFAGMEVKFTVADGTLTVRRVEQA